MVIWGDKVVYGVSVFAFYAIRGDHVVFTDAEAEADVR